MGQYRQWLSYREADQQFQNQIKESEQELVQLYTQIEQLEADTTYPENIILQMLIGLQQAEKAPRKRAVSRALSTSEEPSTAEESSTSEEQRTAGGQSTAERISVPQRRSVSSALFGWGNLPNFDTHGIQQPSTDPQNQPFVPPAQHHDDNLLPQEPNPLTDDSSQTDPQLNVPWWLRDAQPVVQEDPQSTQPIDQLSQRTNQYVQRWFERWGKSANQSEQAQESQSNERKT
jgi:hypothetical protein